MQQTNDKFPAIQLTVDRVLCDSKWELSYKISVLDVTWISSNLKRLTL